jgi:hypothetical protein
MQREVYLLFYELAPLELQDGVTVGSAGGSSSVGGGEHEKTRRLERGGSRGERERGDIRLVRELVERTKVR